MTNIMTRAWEIAKEGQNKFGGNVKEYFAESLKMAWAESRKTPKVELVLSSGSRKHKTWVAKIKGKHEKWKFEREFVEESPKFNGKVYYLEDGTYDICDGGDRDYMIIKNGILNYVGEGAVMESIA